MTDRWLRKRIAVTRFASVVAALAAMLIAAESCRAGNGERIVVPAASVKLPRGGIRLEVDMYWVQGRGYRPVRIDATAATSVSYDRNIEFSFAAGSHWGYGSRGMTATRQFVLPAGNTAASTTISVPQFERWQVISWDVYVNGVHHPDLSVHYDGPAQLQDSWDEPWPRVLTIVDSPQTKSRPVTSVVPARTPGRSPTYNHAAVVQEATSVQAWLEIKELPDRWIDYSGVDIVNVTFEQLKTIARQRPRVWQALRRRTRAGGNLAVDGLGADWQGLQSLESLLELQATPSDDPLARGWQPTKLNMRFVESNDDEEPRAGISTIRIDDDYADNRSEDGNTPNPVFKPSGSSLIREFGLGTVVAMSEDNDAGRRNSVNNVPSQRIWDVLPVDRQLSRLRRGMTSETSFLDFWSFVVPGVGLPPVGAFRVLITVFVLAIGPLNYFLLRRWRRLHLLLITTPALAALVTLGLFGYAIISDGLTPRVRIRSFTEIDQSRGEAVSWARQSYYASLPPRDGLVMRRDTLVLPFAEYEDFRPFDSQPASRRVDWDNQQRLSRGWLRSRMPVQYLMISARKTDHGLDFNADGQEVRNNLGTDVEQLMVCDRQGELHWAEDIGDGKLASLAPIDLAAAQEKLKQIFRRARTAPPKGLGGYYEGYYGRYGDGYYGDGYYDDQAIVDPDVADSLRQSYWTQFGRIIIDVPGHRTSRLDQALDRLGHTKGYDPENRTYVAIVRRSPEVSVGIPKAIEQESFHVVLGRW